MKLKKYIIFFLSLGFMVSSCAKDTNNLKTISHQKVGDVVISVLNESGTLKQGSGKLYLEFVSITNNKLIDVGNVEGKAVMQMSGMPMYGSISISRSDISGRYEVEYDFSMSGTWNFSINYDGNKQVQFQISIN